MSDRPKVTLSETEYQDAKDKALADHEENGIDENTRDPENILRGRTRGVMGEIAFVKWVRENYDGFAVDWIAGEDGETEPYDVALTRASDGRTITVDVQTRDAAKSYDNWAILKARHLAQAKDDLDLYVCMLGRSSSPELEVVGVTSAERLHKPTQVDQFRFPSPTYYMDELSPYFKTEDLDECPHFADPEGI